MATPQEVFEATQAVGLANVEAGMAFEPQGPNFRPGSDVLKGARYSGPEEIPALVISPDQRKAIGAQDIYD